MNPVESSVVMIVSIEVRPAVLIAGIESFVLRCILVVWIVCGGFSWSWLLLRVSWAYKAFTTFHLWRPRGRRSIVVIIKVVVIAIWISWIHVTVKLCNGVPRVKLRLQARLNLSFKLPFGYTGKFDFTSGLFASFKTFSSAFSAPLSSAFSVFSSWNRRKQREKCMN